MRCIIQTVPSRVEYAKKQAEDFGLPCDIHIDPMTGPFNGFVDTLRNYDYGNEYRFHMQDDLILCDDFKDYIPEVERIMRENDMHLMSLYAPRYRVLKEANEKGKRWVKSLSGFAMQAIVFSPMLVKQMLDDAHYYKGWKHDDWFVTDVCRFHKIGTYVHIPSLCQHNVFNLPSVMKHANHERRTSHTFEPDFVKRWKAGEVKNP
jgi:hypothetical protein